jgi:DNA (cytosine-5)-methyltransferase 1
MKLELATDVDGVALPRLVRHLDLFSGIGGFALAARMVGGIETVGFCEIEEHPQRILKKNFPTIPIHNDVRTLDPNQYGRIDLITGGYPCQPFSTAGNRKGESDPRHLWPYMLRIITEARPTWILCENVKGHITLGLDTVLDDLEREGYAAQAYCIPACSIGAVHRRERLFILAHASSDGFNEGTTRSGNVSADDARRTEGQKEDSQHERCCGVRPVLDGNRYPIGTWGTEPPPLRVDDGLSRRMDRDRAARNKSIGNAIVPQIAAEILRAMMAVNSLLPNLLLTSTSAEYDAD